MPKTELRLSWGNLKIKTRWECSLFERSIIILFLIFKPRKACFYTISILEYVIWEGWGGENMLSTCVHAIGRTEAGHLHQISFFIWPRRAVCASVRKLRRAVAYLHPMIVTCHKLPWCPMLCYDGSLSHDEHLEVALEKVKWAPSTELFSIHTLFSGRLTLGKVLTSMFQAHFGAITQLMLAKCHAGWLSWLWFSCSTILSTSPAVEQSKPSLPNPGLRPDGPPCTDRGRTRGKAIMV